MSEKNINRREFVKNISGGVAALGAIPFLAPAHASYPAPTGTGYIYDDRMLDHIISSGHVECPERLIKIQERMAGTGLAQDVVNLPLLDDPYPYIENIHTSAHISSVKNIPKTGIAAEVAAAGTLGAAKAVCEGTAQNAFCAIRP